MGGCGEHLVERDAVAAPASLLPFIPGIAALRDVSAFLLRRDFDRLVFDRETQGAEQAHVNVRDPDERKPGDRVTAPVVEEQPVPRDDQQCGRHVVTEAVLAREHVEKLSVQQTPRRLAPRGTPVARLAKDLLVRDGPRDACHGYREDEQRHEAERCHRLMPHQ